MFSNVYLLVFAIAFMGCVLATPMVTRVAAFAGAIDRPDQFRRVHKGAIPRMGGLSLAVGLLLACVPVALGGYLDEWPVFLSWWGRQWAVLLAGGIVLLVGVIDDTRGMGPRLKLIGQAAAVCVLMAGGLEIKNLSLLGYQITLSTPLALHAFGQTILVDPVSFAVTMLWFLGCMNVWNLIDGMDGLASGVGLLVSGTLMLVALRQGNEGTAALAAALAGSLAGFLLYNWHPACIFLGDSGSLLIGLLIGVIGVQGSLKGTTTVSILFPLLAMGLPISDTAMAIFRRWVRDLPLSSADRRHIHHLLMGLGLNPRQAALLLYTFSGFLCGVVLLGVTLNNPVQGEFIALILGVSGSVAFLLILTSRLDELGQLRSDLKLRFQRKRQERRAAKVTWETIQKIELCETPDQIWTLLQKTAREMGCDGLRLCCRRDGQTILEREAIPAGHDGEVLDPPTSSPLATFRLTSGEDLRLELALHQSPGAPLEADIAFRAQQRLALATAERLERILARPSVAPELVESSDASGDSGLGGGGLDESTVPMAVGFGQDTSRNMMSLTAMATGRYSMRWLRSALGLEAGRVG